MPWINSVDESNKELFQEALVEIATIDQVTIKEV